VVTHAASHDEVWASKQDRHSGGVLLHMIPVALQVPGAHASVWQGWPSWAPSHGLRFGGTTSARATVASVATRTDATTTRRVEVDEERMDEPRPPIIHERALGAYRLRDTK
jgi:hypothetical protein